VRLVGSGTPLRILKVETAADGDQAALVRSDRGANCKVDRPHDVRSSAAYVGRVPRCVTAANKSFASSIRAGALSCRTRRLSHPESPWTHRRDTSRVRVSTVARVSVWVSAGVVKRGVCAWGGHRRAPDWALRSGPPRQERTPCVSSGLRSTSTGPAPPNGSSRSAQPASNGRNSAGGEIDGCNEETWRQLVSEAAHVAIAPGPFIVDVTGPDFMARCAFAVLTEEAEKYFSRGVELRLVSREPIVYDSSTSVDSAVWPIYPTADFALAMAPRW
jgi:anti-anti-sigma factor